MILVVGKSHLHGRVFEAVVFNKDDGNRVLFRSGIGWNKRGKEACANWIAAYHGTPEKVAAMREP